MEENEMKFVFFVEIAREEEEGKKIEAILC
jgi:hypothetical protein